MKLGYDVLRLRLKYYGTVLLESQKELKYVKHILKYV